jgi:hypothetical protein
MQCVKLWDGFVWCTVGSSENGNEFSGSIKGEKYFHQMSEYWILGTHSAPWTRGNSYLLISIFN